MNTMRFAVPALAMALIFSCSTTGFMGLAREDAVAAMDEKRSREIDELKTHIERIDALSGELEAALAEVARAKADAARAMELAKANADESAAVEKKMEEVRDLLKKLEGRIARMPKEAIDKLVRALQNYVEADE
jgi:glutamine synthetase type III